MVSNNGAHPPGGEPHPALTALATVETDLDNLLDTHLWQLGDHDLAELTATLQRTANKLDAVRLAALQHVQTRGTAAALAATSTTTWLATTTRVRHAAARADLALSDALHQHWPALHAAVRAGQVSTDQARVCVAALQALPAEVDTDTLTRAEAFLLAQCAHFDPAALTKLGKHLLAVIDPDGPGELERDEQTAARNRELRVSQTRDGGVKLTGRLDAEGAATLMSALDPLAAPRPTTAEGADLRDAARRHGDALVELSRRALDSGELPEQGKEKPHLSVTLDYDTLRRLPHVAAAELERGGPLSPEAARRLACDAKVIPVVLDGQGMPLDVGREQRTVPRHLRRAVTVRDRGCAFGGCGRPPAWCDAHHIIHWADGGTTSLDNLVLLCGHHHNVLHHTGWTVTIGPDGHPVFTAPTRGAGHPHRPPRSAHQLRQDLRAVAVPPDPPPEPSAPEPTQDEDRQPRGP